MIAELAERALRDHALRGGELPPRPVRPAYEPDPTIREIFELLDRLPRAQTAPCRRCYTALGRPYAEDYCPIGQKLLEEATRANAKCAGCGVHRRHDLPCPDPRCRKGHDGLYYFKWIIRPLSFTIPPKESDMMLSLMDDAERYERRYEALTYNGVKHGAWHWERVS